MVHSFTNFFVEKQKAIYSKRSNHEGRNDGLGGAGKTWQRSKDGRKRSRARGEARSLAELVSKPEATKFKVTITSAQAWQSNEIRSNGKESAGEKEIKEYKVLNWMIKENRKQELA